MTPNAKRSSVTVAVMTSPDRRRQRDLLEALKDQLLPFDNLVLLGARQDPCSPSSWWEKRTNGELARPTVTPRTRDLVVVVEDAVLPANGLVDALVRAAGDPAVGAVAARSNVADGDDLVLGLPYRPDDAGARRAALQSWARSHPARTTAATHLGGPCILVRREVLDAAGGLAGLGEAGTGPAIDLVRSEGRALLVAEDAFVHHHGGIRRRSPGSSWPLVTACLIVKNEEADLRDCLASAAGVADEIVVYDTGSTDRTVELARELGAVVLLGTWDGDFARARNAALEACRGQWILWLDADERLVCDERPRLKALLEETPSEVEGYFVLIDNLQGTEASTTLTHPAVRLFRRSSCRWEGRLHEQVVRRHENGHPRLRQLEAGRILHRGYLQKALRERDKGARNLHSAFADLAGGSELALDLRVLSLGRSHLLAGSTQQGVDVCERALELASSPSTRRLALRALSDGYTALGRHDEALAVADDYRRHATRPVLADLIEGRARLELDEPAEALACFERLDRVMVDDDGFEYRPSLAAASRASALVALGRHEEAAEVLLATLRANGGLDAHLGQLVEALEASGRDLGEIYDALPAGRALAFLPQLLQMQPEAADRVLEAWHGRDDTSQPVLAAAGRVAIRLAIDRRLVWSARLRAKGLRLSCPLVAATTRGLPAADRVLSSAVAWVSFGDERARQAFGASVLDLPVEERPELRSQLAMLSSDLVDVFDALAPVTRPERAAAAPGDGPCVLVVSPVPCALGAVARAAELAGGGARVVLVQPFPIASTEIVLGPANVTVRGWLDPGDEHWPEAAAAVVADVYASTEIDAAVLMEGGEAFEARLRALLPCTSIVPDGPGTPGGTAAIVEHLGDAPPLPGEARAGICLALDARGERAATGRATLEALVTGLAERFPQLSACLCGDDPGQPLASAHPALIAVGPSADPTPWVRSAQALVVLGTADDGQWLALGSAHGTPSFLATSPGAVAEVLDHLEAVTAGLPIAPADLPSGAGAAMAPTAVTSALRTRTGAHRMPRRRHHPSTLRSGDDRPRVLLRGPLADASATAQVNRSLARHLDDPTLGFELVVATDEHVGPRDEAPPSGPGRTTPVEDDGIALELRHLPEPSFVPAPDRQLVIAQALPHGGRLPLEWVGPVRDAPDELWVPSEAARTAALESGIEAVRVQVLGTGVDLACFTPDGPRLPLRTDRATTLLFVGPASETSGIDALFEAYLTSFTESDDVCLVVHLEGDDSTRLAGDVRRAAAVAGPAIELVEGPLSVPERAALYRSCDAFVHPARFDPYGLRLAEAIASGRPVVSTEGSSFLDGDAGAFAWLLEAQPRPAPPLAAGLVTPDAVIYEPRRKALGQALRGLTEQSDLVGQFAATARAYASAHLDAAAVAAQVAARLDLLLPRPTLAARL